MPPSRSSDMRTPNLGCVGRKGSSNDRLSRAEAPPPAHVGSGRGARAGAGMGQRYRRPDRMAPARLRSEEHTSELQSLMRISYAVFCLKKKKEKKIPRQNNKTTRKRIKTR